jgi:hypothetical protein
VEENGPEENGISNRQLSPSFIPPLTMQTQARVIVAPDSPFQGRVAMRTGRVSSVLRQVLTPRRLGLRHRLHGITHGGWCPRGRKAEDGMIDPRYQLKETPSADYVRRTEWNVRDSDGALVFYIAAAVTGGSTKTVELDA